MTVDTCISSLQKALQLLSDAHPKGSSTLIPYLTMSRPSTRYNCVNDYKRLLNRFSATRELLTRIVGRVREVELELEQEERAVQNALAPVHSLPTECMREVFLALAQGSIYCDSGRILSQVCSFWRTLCLSIPEVWTNTRDYQTALRMVKVNGSRQIKLPLRITLSHNLDLLDVLESTEGITPDGLDVVDSVCIVVSKSHQNSGPVPEFNTARTLEEIVVRTSMSGKWVSSKPPVDDDGFENDDTDLTISACSTPSSLQVHGCLVEMEEAFDGTPAEIVLSDVTIHDAERIYQSAGVGIPPRLHLRRISCGDVGDTQGHIDSFLWCMTHPESRIPDSLVLEECDPELSIALLNELTLGREDHHMVEDIQVVLPDLRLESPTLTDRLKTALNALPHVFWSCQFSIAISAPLPWIFDIMIDTIKARTKAALTNQELLPLHLRLSVPQWSKDDATSYNHFLRKRWEEFSLVTVALKSVSLHLSLTITGSLVEGFEDIARTYFEVLTFLPEGDELALDYSRAKYSRDHYEFTK